MTDAKTPRASRVVMTESVLPGDGNPLGTAFGGRIAQWIDVAAAIACQRHCRRRVVTASMDDLHFLKPIRVGMIVELRAQVNATFRTSRCRRSCWRTTRIAAATRTPGAAARCAWSTRA